MKYSIVDGESEGVPALSRSTVPSGLFPRVLNATLPPFYLFGRQATVNPPKRQITSAEHLISANRVDNRTTARFGLSLRLNPHKSVSTSKSGSHFQISLDVFALHCQTERCKMEWMSVCQLFIHHWDTFFIQYHGILRRYSRYK